VIRSMPSTIDIELRNRAVVAFIVLTGARDGAVASLKLKHIDLDERVVHQDAEIVKTKRRKIFSTWFFPVDDENPPDRGRLGGVPSSQETVGDG
jgi:integrase